MASLVDTADTEVIVAYHLFGILDGGADLRAQIEVTSWLNVGESRVFVRTSEDAMHAMLRLEVWDGPPMFEEAAWQQAEVIELLMPTGQIAADQIDAGFSSPLFTLPEPGQYRVQIAIREEPAQPVAPGTPDWEWEGPPVWVLAQFWRA